MKKVNKNSMSIKNNRGASIASVVIAIVAVIIIILLSLGAGALLHKRYLDKKEKEERITSLEVSQTLESASDLTTEKIIYQGVIHYEEGEIPFIDKKSYNMTYKAEIDAGVDVSEIEVTDNGDKIVIEIPDSEVQSVYVDPSSIEFYDESFALFNWDKKQDGVDAVALAEADAKEHADIETLKEEADKHARELIENLFSDAIRDQQLEVR